MAASIIVLLAVLLVLVVLHVVDDAVRVLRSATKAEGLTGLVWSKRIAWVLLVAVAVQFFLPEGTPTATNAPAEPLPQAATYSSDSLWTGADTARLAFLDDAHESMVRYGHDLIMSTAAYLGPKGSVAQQTNGMNCQNCHLDAGTRPWGNNYGAVWSTYPKMRARSGRMESVVKRVNDCFERSLNGTALDSTSREMQAIVAYMEWLGTGVARNSKPKGTGIVELAYLDRAADPKSGEAVFAAKCTSCHGRDGQGMLKPDGITYMYPPLWGEHSYNQGAGLYRISRFAGYVKANMPQGATWQNPQLSDEEAWDVAAFVNSQPRPGRDLSGDWPDISKKPVDHPFGPFADKFPEKQHKYGPFGPIAAFYKKP
jgi:thiosulfate dehydrogenase